MNIIESRILFVDFKEIGLSEVFSQDYIVRSLRFFPIKNNFNIAREDTSIFILVKCLLHYIRNFVYLLYYEELFYEWNLRIDCRSCVWIFEFEINK